MPTPIWQATSRMRYQANSVSIRLMASEFQEEPPVVEGAEEGSET